MLAFGIYPVHTTGCTGWLIGKGNTHKAGGEDTSVWSASRLRRSDGMIIDKGRWEEGGERERERERENWVFQMWNSN